MKYLIVAILLCASLARAEVRPFESGSLHRIQAERSGKPFILALWSASCIHCPAELKTLGKLVKRHPGLDVVLVAADTPAEIPMLEKLAASYGLAHQSQWVFADDPPEKIRHELDRRWYGELPRTYLFDAAHNREAHSGVIPPVELERWTREHVK